jgi:hypothetical protein
MFIQTVILSALLPFLASVSRDAANPRDYVAGFYLSATPSPFACCSGALS